MIFTIVKYNETLLDYGITIVVYKHNYNYWYRKINTIDIKNHYR